MKVVLQMFFIIGFGSSLSQNNNRLLTRVLVNAWSEYDTWTHLDPFYINEPSQAADNFRPVDYEERHTYIYHEVSDWGFQSSTKLYQRMEKSKTYTRWRY